MSPIGKRIPMRIFSAYLEFFEIYLRHRGLKYITLAETLNYGLNEAAFDFNSVFFKQFVPEWSLGIFRAINHFANSAANYLSCYVSKKISLKMTIILGVFLDNFVNTTSVLVASILSPVIKIMAAFSNGLKDPALDSLIKNDCSEQQRATIISVISLLQCLFIHPAPYQSACWLMQQAHTQRC